MYFDIYFFLGKDGTRKKKYTLGIYSLTSAQSTLVKTIHL